MSSFEQRFRPPILGNAWARDLLGLGLLMALMLVLLPISTSPGRYPSHLAGQLLSTYLLVALGFTLALRRGAIDLSVWALSGMGGVAAAMAIHAGVAPLWAMAAGIGLGLLVGAFNGLTVALVRLPSIAVSLAMAAGTGWLVAWVAIPAGMKPLWAVLAAVGAGLLAGAINALLVRSRHLPSFIVTLVVAFVAVWGAQKITHGWAAAAPPRGEFLKDRAIHVPSSVFDAWHFSSQVAEEEGGKAPGAAQGGEAAQTPWLPLSLTRMVLVAGVYILTMVVLMVASNAAKRGVNVSEAWQLFAALCASGALAAAGGTFWMLDQSSAPIPTRPVDDLRVPVAAVLAGAALFGGRGRTLLAMICLPSALMLATLWRQEAWDFYFYGYELQMILLLGMILMVHRAIDQVLSVRSTGRWLALASMAMTASGILILGQANSLADHVARRLFYVFSLGIWLVGTMLLVVSRVLASRGPAPART